MTQRPRSERRRPRTIGVGAPSQDSRADIVRSRSSSGCRWWPPPCPIIVLVPPFSGFSAQIIWLDGFTNAGVFVLLALGLNIVVGLSGLLDLGYAAFFAIGAYSSYALRHSALTPTAASFWPMLLVGAGVAAVFGILLGAPTLRLRGDYLAIVTLGFGEIVPFVILNSSDYTDGPNGIGGIVDRRSSSASTVPDRRQRLAVLPGHGRAHHDRR